MKIYNRYCLHKAILNQDFSFVNKYLEDLSETNRNKKISSSRLFRDFTTGINAIDLAILLDKSKAVELLLSSFEIDYEDVDPENGWSYLHRASYLCNLKVITILLKYYKPEDFLLLKDFEGLSPYDLLQMKMESGTKKSLENGFFGTDLFAFGNNKNWNLGLDDDVDHRIPRKIDFLKSNKAPFKIKKLSSNKYHTVIITDEFKNIYICGVVNTIQNKKDVDKSSFKKSATIGFKKLEFKAEGCVYPALDIDTGINHTIVLFSNNKVCLFGTNEHYQLGIAFELRC